MSVVTAEGAPRAPWLRDLRDSWRSWRLRRFDRFVAERVARRDPAGDFYYSKIFSEAMRNARVTRESIASLVGRRNAEDLYLMEAARIGRPGKVVLSAALVTSFAAAPLAGALSGIVGFVFGVSCFAGSRSLTQHRARSIRYATSVGGGPVYEHSWDVLSLFHDRTWRKMLKRGVRDMPAQALCESNRTRDILEALEFGDAEFIETLRSLADGYEGTVGDLVTAARLLH